MNRQSGQSSSVPSHRLFRSLRIWLRLAASVCLLFALTAVILVVFKDGTESSSIGYVSLFLIALVSSATFVIPGPSIAGVILGGVALNPFFVGLIMGCGSAVGEIPGYMLGMTNDKVFTGIPGSGFVVNWMQRRATMTIFLLAAIPNYLFDIGSLFAGASRMPLKHFLAATLFGKIIRFTAAAVVASWISTAVQ